MEYKDILNAQKAKLPVDRKWWPDYLYHFTDVHNAANILKDNYIWSRDYVQKNGNMINDNASKAVIEATMSENKSYARLYFRPLTPTQFRNEGYKPKAIRGDANCPVPIFLCLDASKVLSYYGTKFAPRGLAGNRCDIEEGVDAFSKLNFDKIYHDGSYRPEDSDIKEYRLSEVIREDGFPIKPFLQHILCRSWAEAETLLNLTKTASINAYNSYYPLVKVDPRLKCFNVKETGIFIQYVRLKANILTIGFNAPESREQIYQESLHFLLRIEINYMCNGKLLRNKSQNTLCDYLTISSYQLPIQFPERCTSIIIKIDFDDCEMYDNEILVNPYV